MCRGLLSLRLPTRSRLPPSGHSSFGIPDYWVTRSTAPSDERKHVIPLRRHDLIRPDATIRYYTGGPAGAPTAVLLHGATLDHRAWTPQTDVLRERFRVVVPDLRAHGRSTGRFDFELAVQDVL